jgi:HEAT repeat protein
MGNPDWKALTKLLVDGVDQAVARVARQKPPQTFYALAFVDGYAEAEGPISPPTVAMNSVEAARDMHPGADEHDFWGERWSPPNWRWPELPVGGGALAARYRAITKLAGAGSLAHWLRVDARQAAAVAAAVAELARRARRGTGGFAALRRTKDFVVFRSDGSDDGPSIAQRTIPPATFNRLFPSLGPQRRQRAAVTKLPATDRAQYLISRFSKFEPPVDSEQATEQLIAMGARAVPALIEALDDSEDGWMAAMVLAKIGTPAADAAIPSLLAHARRKCRAQMWSATALGAFGRLADLMKLAASPATQSAAVEGLKHGRPGSYAALDELLARRDRKLARLIASALAPGSASFEKTPADFDAIARATASPHAIVRADAASALGDSDLGERNRARAVPILVGLLADRSSEVRRLATLALGWCKRHAKPELARIRAMSNDPVPGVRVAAENALREIAGRR